MDDRIDRLVAELGRSDRAARELIELGEPSLAVVDELAADASRPTEVRRAASLVAHHIRARMMRAPAAPARAPEWPGGEVDIRDWIERGGTVAGDGFGGRHDLRSFVDALYAAGAPRVTVTDAASVVVVALPAEDAAARARLFAFYNAEIDALGEAFGGEEPAGHQLSRDEALAIADPDAEGQWCVDDLHVVDSGQIALRFWWD